jgi:hypothetical protein
VNATVPPKKRPSRFYLHTESLQMDNKAKIRKIMIDHMTGLGWPKTSRQLVVHELKAMWAKLEDAGLIESGWTFKGFQEVANQAFCEAELIDYFT